MPLTVERFSSSAWLPPWCKYQHACRYHWIAEQVRGLDVADVACGTGYGSALMADSGANFVHGFDLAAAAIDEAKSAYSRPNVAFTLGDAQALPVEDRRFDVVVSFETIEHLEDDRQFVDEVCRILRPRGRFVCSTPNRQVTNPGTGLGSRPYNPHHLREYSREDLERLLAHRFDAVAWFGQSMYASRYVRFLDSVARWSPKIAVRFHQARKVLGIPWESTHRHWPCRTAGGCEPEILIADCQRNGSRE